MNRLQKYLSTSAWIALIALISACASEGGTSATEQTSDSETNPTPQTEVRLAGGDYTDFHGSVTRNEAGNAAVTDTGNHHLDYTAEIPEAGRYKISINAARRTDDPASLWIEDYRDNKDDRTYDITAEIPVKNTLDAGYSANVKTGSPMNEGTHKIRLHVNGSVNIESIRFELIKSHRPTPENMVQATDGDTWEVVWADEFDEGTMPDTSRWTYDIGDWGWGNHELQYYTKADADNARIEDGNLIIEARKDAEGNWTSARLTTREKVSFTYGKIEFRAKVPAEKGNWAAGWTLGDSYVDELSWPYCGEIDILESVGYEMDNETGNGIAHASAHTPAYYFKLGNQPTGTIKVENMNNAFHTYAVEWTPEYITAFVDDTPYFTYDDTSSELTWPFDQPQNIILNLTMGGGWGGLKGMDESVTSQKMVVDYVRVYEKK